MLQHPARSRFLAVVSVLMVAGVYSPRWFSAQQVPGSPRLSAARTQSAKTAFPLIPSPTGTCPALSPERMQGKVLSYNPKGLSVPQSEEDRPPFLWKRNVTVWMDARGGQPPRGPLVFYWHGTNGDATEAEKALGQDVIRAILDEGGVIVAPDPEMNTDSWRILTYLWYIADGRQETYDLLLADEVAACFAASGRIDPRRIYSIGFSAGGMQTVQLAFERPYIAGIVSYSGSPVELPEPVPGSDFAALLTYGFDEEKDAAFDFRITQENLFQRLREMKKFAVLCDESPQGHQIPEHFGPAAWQFLRNHVYGRPSPWGKGLPSNFPPGCRVR